VHEKLTVSQLEVLASDFLARFTHKTVTFVHHPPEDYHLERKAICLWVSRVGDSVVRKELVHDSSESATHPVGVQEMFSLYCGVLHALD